MLDGYICHYLWLKLSLSLEEAVFWCLMILNYGSIRQSLSFQNSSQVHVLVLSLRLVSWPGGIKILIAKLVEEKHLSV